MADEATKQLRKIAAEFYDNTSGAGDTFDLAAVIDMVERDRTAASLGRALLRAAADAAVRYVDDQRRDRPETQGKLFDDLERVLAIGDGQRRRKGNCTARDMAQHIAIITANAAAVTAAAARDQQEYALLLPFLAQGMTVEQAVEAGAGR